MWSHINVFGRAFSSFGLMALLAFLTGGLLVYMLAKKKGQTSPEDALMTGLIAICGGIVGAYALRPVMRVFEILFNWQQYGAYPLSVLFQHSFGSIVFYGGLIGGLIASFLYCRLFKMDVLPLLDLFAPALALAHGIGRIGCLFAGCCYGIAVEAGHVFAIRYPQSSLGAPPEVSLLATPLIEAILLACLGLLLVIVYLKSQKVGLSARLYLLLYPLMRFVLEFFRGDVGRGEYGPFSTSQLISIVLFFFGIVYFAYRNRRRKSV